MIPYIDRIDTLINPIVDLYAEFENTVIRDIARRIAKASELTGSARWQSIRLSEAMVVHQDMILQIAKLTGKSEQEVRNMFRKAGIAVVEGNNLSVPMLRLLEHGIARTNGELHNLTLSTVSAAQQAFIHGADIAYMQVATGTMSHQQAVRNAVLEIARQGLTSVQYASGRQQLVVAVRRAVLTGIGNTAIGMQIELAGELGTDLIEVSAHVGARNHGVGPANHESWQGKIYSISGSSLHYPSLIEVTGYGTGAGLGGWNCRHMAYPYIEGVDQPEHRQRELDAYAKRKVTYNGREMTIYDAQQKQRGMERAIRKTKREAAALNGAGLDNTNERIMLGKQQEALRDFIKQTGLDRQRWREQIPGISVNALKGYGKLIKDQPIIFTNGGALVSSAIDVKVKNEAAKEIIDALKTIDTVHGDGKLPVIPLYQRYISAGVQGAFRYIPYEKRAVDILIRPDITRPRMTTIHEVGHFIDVKALTPIDSSAENKLKDVLSEWWNAIQNSKAYKKWHTIKADGGLIWLDGQFQKIGKEFVDYAISPDELWARSYTQYIAVESNNMRLKQELFSSIEEMIPYQWQLDDFEIIRKSIYNIFKGMGWKK